MKSDIVSWIDIRLDYHRSRHLWFFWSEKVNFADILKFSLVETTKIHLFSKVEKFRKGKLCLLCKPPVWWKISGRHLLKEYGILKVLELSKTWKFKLSSKICFEKIDTFESHEARKDKNSKFFWFCNRSLHEKLLKDVFWQKWWLLKALKAEKFPVVA